MIASLLSGALLRSGAALLALSSAEIDPALGWLDLEWSAAEGCPTQASVVSTAEGLTRGGMPRPLRAEARVDEQGGLYTLELVVDDPQGAQSRVLTGPSCDSLADAVAVILVVASDPVTLAERIVAPERGIEDSAIELGPPEPLSPATPAQGPADARRPSPAKPRREHRWPTLELGASLVGGLGPSQRPAWGFSGGAGFVWTHLRADLRGSYWMPSRAAAPERQDMGAELTLAAGAARVGPRWSWGRLSLALVGGVELGALTAQGYGIGENHRSRGLWGAGLLAPRLAWRPLRWLSLAAEVEGIVAVTRRSYTAVGSDEILYTVPLGGVRIVGGVTFVLH